MSELASPDSRDSAVLALGEDGVHCHALLSAYVQCKSQVPGMTGLFVLPKTSHASH